MKRKSSKDMLTMIDSALDVSQKFRKDYKIATQYYRGNQWSLDDREEGQLVNEDMHPIVVNWTFNTVRTIVPTFFFKNPRIFTQATRDRFLDRVDLVNNIVNYDWRLLKVKKEIKRSILRSILGGLSWVETGYSFIEEEIDKEEVELPGPDASPEKILTGGGVSRETENETKFTELRIKKDSPYVISRSLLDVATDPFANELEEMAWYAIREVKPLEFVKKDPRYERTGKLSSNVKIDDIKDSVNKSRREYRGKIEAELVELWHFTDRWRGKTFTIARDHKGGPLRDFDTPVGYDLVPLFFNEDPESTQHVSVVSIMRDQQDEINKLRGLMLEHVKRSLPRMAYNSVELTDEEALANLADSEMHELIGLPGDPNQLLKAINFPTLSPDLYAVDSRVKDDMQVSSGLSDFQRGQAAKVPSATEAQLIEQSSRLRVDEGLDVVSELAEKISKNIFQLRQKFTTQEQAVPIIGEDMVPIWSQLKTYTREQIQGDFEFFVEYGSTQKKDQDFMKNQWLQLAPIISNLKAQALQLPELNIVGRELLKQFDVSKDNIDQLFPLPQPQQENPLQALTQGTEVAEPPVTAQDLFGSILGG